MKKEKEKSVLGDKDSKLEVRGGIVDTGCTAVVAHSSSVDARGVLQSRREAGKRNAGMEVERCGERLQCSAAFWNRV